MRHPVMIAAVSLALTVTGLAVAQQQDALREVSGEIDSSFVIPSTSESEGHLIVRVIPDDSNREVLVNLGSPEDARQMDIRPGNRISVRGYEDTAAGYEVLTAEDSRIGRAQSPQRRARADEPQQTKVDQQTALSAQRQFLHDQYKQQEGQLVGPREFLEDEPRARMEEDRSGERQRQEDRAAPTDQPRRAEVQAREGKYQAEEEWIGIEDPQARETQRARYPSVHDERAVQRHAERQARMQQRMDENVNRMRDSLEMDAQDRSQRARPVEARERPEEADFREFEQRRSPQRQVREPARHQDETQQDFFGGDEMSRSAQQRSDKQGLRTVRGTIDSFKTFAIDGEDHRFVKIRDERTGKSHIANIGQVDAIADIDLRPGDRVTIQGESARLNGKSVLLATRLSQEFELNQTARDQRKSQRGGTTETRR